jgi:hypothetical protein
LAKRGDEARSTEDKKVDKNKEEDEEISTDYSMVYKATP